MNIPVEPEHRSYDAFYEQFDSPLMQQLRVEAYGTDIGQHSWESTEELEHDTSLLTLSPKSRILDLGCGPCGPSTFIASSIGCHVTGIDLSAPALSSGRTRVKAMGLEHLVSLYETDLNERLPFADSSFDAVISLDVILHLRDRGQLFREAARVLVPGGVFLFTDAGVITAAVSDDEIQSRSLHGYTQFVPHGLNEHLLDAAGFELVQNEDRTSSLKVIASQRLAARLAHREDLRELEGDDCFESQCQYVNTVLNLAQRNAMSRMMYLARSLSAT